MQIAIQGEAGSFHDMAARRFFEHQEYTLVGLPSFSQVFKTLANGEANFGVVAAENSLFGSIHETYDQLLKYPFTIISEINLPIHQQLIADFGTKLEDIKEVSSHPAALDQCRRFLETNLPAAKIIEHTDTAGAVKDLAQKPNKHAAAIASAVAAQMYDMSIIAENIEDEPDNITRFIVLSAKPKPIPKANKASMVLTTPHQPGALYQALGVFAKNEANLTKLESRPVRGKPFQYQFIVDVMASQDQLISLTHELEQINCSTQLLGHYMSYGQS